MTTQTIEITDLTVPGGKRKVELHDPERHTDDGMPVAIGLRDIAECGTCHRSWCERCSPTPSARCPFEYEHPEVKPVRAWPDPDDDGDLAAYHDWQSEVADGDTVLGFRPWQEARHG